MEDINGEKRPDTKIEVAWSEKYREGIMIASVIIFLYILQMILLKTSSITQSSVFLVFFPIISVLVIYLIIYIVRCYLRPVPATADQMVISKIDRPRFSVSAIIGFVFSVLSLSLCILGYALNFKGISNYPMRTGPQLNANSWGGFVSLATLSFVAGFFMDIVGIFTSRKKWFSILGLLIALLSIPLIILFAIILIGGAII